MSAIEWKSLSEVFEMRGGYTPSTKNDEFWEDGILPWFRMEDIREKGNILSDSTLHITPIALKKNGLFPQNSIILATSATIGVHALLTVPALSNQRFTAFYPKEEYEDKINYKFTYYVFYLIDEWCKNNIVQGGFASVDMTGLKKYLIPIPSLAKQQEIVSHLDTFTTLISNLESELDMRRKQYEHYRNQLLDFEGVEGVEWKSLGDVCKIMNGKDYKSLSDGNFPVYGSGGIMAYVDTFAYNRPSVLLPRKGSLNNVFYVDEPFWTVDTIYWTIINEEIILPKYFYCYMAMQNLEKLNIAAGAVPSLTQSILNKINIPLPTIFKQREIVEKLDAFENLIQSLEQEIKLRKQQYEYYREKLLTFE